jgi:drug/metabolite transporter (DMT)-like permease
MALGSNAIDAYSFTAFRLGSGAIVLSLLNLPKRHHQSPSCGNWKGAFFLIAYALPFSLAYVRVDTGTGALILFGAVQMTMIGQSFRAGARPGPFEWLGMAGAAGGVVYLVLPGVTAPDPLGAVLMVLAGIGWGGYSILGKSVGQPASATAGNFYRAAVLVVPATAVAWPWLELSPEGILLASSSGALASGLGYTVWYAALKYLSLTRGALVQLAVPVIAAAGGVVFVGESVTRRLGIASVLVLGSIAFGILSRTRVSEVRIEKQGR